MSAFGENRKDQLYEEICYQFDEGLTLEEIIRCFTHFIECDYEYKMEEKYILINDENRKLKEEIKKLKENK